MTPNPWRRGLAACSAGKRAEERKSSRASLERMRSPVSFPSVSSRAVSNGMARRRIRNFGSRNCLSPRGWNTRMTAAETAAVT